MAGLLSTSILPGVSSSAMTVGVGPMRVTIWTFGGMCGPGSSAVRTGRNESAVVRSSVFKTGNSV